MSWFTFLNKSSSSWLQGFCPKDLEEDLGGSLQSLSFTLVNFTENIKWKWSDTGIHTEYYLHVLHVIMLFDVVWSLNSTSVFFCLFSCRQRQSSKPDVIETDPLQIFLAAVENSKPVIGVRGTKKGGKVYQVINIEPLLHRWLSMPIFVSMS